MIRAFSDAIHDVFGYAALLAMVGTLLGCFVKERRHGGGRPAGTAVD